MPIFPGDDDPVGGDNIAASLLFALTAAAAIGGVGNVESALVGSLTMEATASTQSPVAVNMSMPLGLIAHCIAVPPPPNSFMSLWLNCEATGSGVAALATSQTLSLSLSATLTAGAVQLFPVDDLAVVAASATSATLTFNYPHSIVGHAGFRIWREGVDYGLVSAATSKTISSPTLVVSGLTPGARYVWHVRAESNTGARGEERSVALTFQSSVSVPPPTSLSSSSGVREATVFWEAPVGALASGQRIDFYEVRLFGIYLARVRSGVFSYRMTGLVPGSPANFTVAAVDNFGNISSVEQAATATPTGTGSSYMTATDFTDMTDLFAKAWLRIRGDGTTYGGGAGPSVAIGSDWGISKTLRDLESTINTIGEYEITSSMLGPLRAAQVASSNDVFARSVLGPSLAAFSGMAYLQGLSSVYDLPSLTRFFNTGAGGPWSALHAPEFGTLYLACSGSNLPASYCLYAPAGVTLASRVVGSSMVAGTAVDDTLYAGAGKADAVVTGWGGTSGVLTVTGVARPSTSSESITPISGRTFSATVSGNGTIVLMPSVSGDLLLSVSAIAPPAGMSSGTITIQTAVPTGRTAITA
jgi:hypothetical protein